MVVHEYRGDIIVESCTRCAAVVSLRLGFGYLRRMTAHGRIYLRDERTRTIQSGPSQSTACWAPSFSSAAPPLERRKGYSLDRHAAFSPSSAALL